MERVKALINKLQEQLDQNNDISAMMVTVQLLQVELQQAAQNERPQFGSAKVAVVLPSYNSYYTKVSTELPVNEEVKEPVEKSGIMEEAVPEDVTSPSTKVEEPIHYVLKENDTSVEWLFDAVREIPTLAHQSDLKEINDVIAKNNSSSLNDRLKNNTTELGDIIVDSPVKDLRKAIGINDRYVFLNELFRGDEVMYERSIKTINNFRILAEALYWIERELKLKLGWDESKTSVKQFDQLVKRRFS